MDDPASVDVVRIVRQRSEHNISRRQIDPDALRVLYRLMRSGFTAYLVGGGVRDLLLGVQPKDFDVATDAHPREIRRLFRNSFLIGRRFRLVHVRFGDNVIETSTFRRRPETEDPAAEVETAEPGVEGVEPEAEDAGGRYHESDNTFGTAEEDAWRRDFTINALFYDIRTFAIIDHVGGLQDLEQRLIRSIGKPDVRFLEDPVRMVRAVRFAARLGCTIEAETYAAIIRNADHLKVAAPARMLEEIYKLFPYAAGEPAFRLLYQTGLLAVMFPELAEFLDRGSPETRLFWGHLAALGQRERDGMGPADAALIFAVLFYAPFIEGLRLDGRETDYARQAATARRLLEPVAARYRMPKRVFYRAVLLLDGQRRFEGGADRTRQRFVHHEAFGDMLNLRRIHLVASGESLDSLAGWEARLAEVTPRHGAGRGSRRREPEVSEVVAGDQSTAPEGAPAPVAGEDERRRRSRRRGGRGRRGPGGRGEAGQAAPTDAGPA